MWQHERKGGAQEKDSAGGGLKSSFPPGPQPGRQDALGAERWGGIALPGKPESQGARVHSDPDPVRGVPPAPFLTWPLITLISSS